MPQDIKVHNNDSELLADYFNLIEIINRDSRADSESKKLYLDV